MFSWCARDISTSGNYYTNEPIQSLEVRGEEETASNIKVIFGIHEQVCMNKLNEPHEDIRVLEFMHNNKNEIDSGKCLIDTASPKQRKLKERRDHRKKLFIEQENQRHSINTSNFENTNTVLSSPGTCEHVSSMRDSASRFQRNASNAIGNFEGSHNNTIGPLLAPRCHSLLESQESDTKYLQIVQDDSIKRDNKEMLSEQPTDINEAYAANSISARENEFFKSVNGEIVAIPSQNQKLKSVMYTIDEESQIDNESIKSNSSSIFEQIIDGSRQRTSHNNSDTESSLFEGRIPPTNVHTSMDISDIAMGKPKQVIVDTVLPYDNCLQNRVRITEFPFDKILSAVDGLVVDDEFYREHLLKDNLKERKLATVAQNQDDCPKPAEASTFIDIYSQQLFSNASSSPEYNVRKCSAKTPIIHASTSASHTTFNIRNPKRTPQKPKFRLNTGLLKMVRRLEDVSSEIVTNSEFIHKHGDGDFSLNRKIKSDLPSCRNESETLKSMEFKKIKQQVQKPDDHDNSSVENAETLHDSSAMQQLTPKSESSYAQKYSVKFRQNLNELKQFYDNIIDEFEYEAKNPCNINENAKQSSGSNFDSFSETDKSVNCCSTNKTSLMCIKDNSTQCISGKIVRNKLPITISNIWRNNSNENIDNNHMRGSEIIVTSHTSNLPMPESTILSEIAVAEEVDTSSVCDNISIENVPVIERAENVSVSTASMEKYTFNSFGNSIQNQICIPNSIEAFKSQLKNLLSVKSNIKSDRPKILPKPLKHPFQNKIYDFNLFHFNKHNIHNMNGSTLSNHPLANENALQIIGESDRSYQDFVLCFGASACETVDYGNLDNYSCTENKLFQLESPNFSSCIINATMISSISAHENTCSRNYRTQHESCVSISTLSTPISSIIPPSSLDQVLEILPDYPLLANEPVYSAMFFTLPSKSFLHSSKAPKLVPPAPPPKPSRLRKISDFRSELGDPSRNCAKNNRTMNTQFSENVLQKQDYGNVHKIDNSEIERNTLTRTKLIELAIGDVNCSSKSSVVKYKPKPYTNQQYLTADAESNSEVLSYSRIKQFFRKSKKMKNKIVDKAEECPPAIISSSMTSKLNQEIRNEDVSLLLTEEIKETELCEKSRVCKNICRDSNTKLNEDNERCLSVFELINKDYDICHGSKICHPYDAITTADVAINCYPKDVLSFRHQNVSPITNSNDVIEREHFLFLNEEPSITLMDENIGCENMEMNSNGNVLQSRRRKKCHSTQSKMVAHRRKANASRLTKRNRRSRNSRVKYITKSKVSKRRVNISRNIIRNRSIPSSPKIQACCCLHSHGNIDVSMFEKFNSPAKIQQILSKPTITTFDIQQLKVLQKCSHNKVSSYLLL